MTEATATIGAGVTSPPVRGSALQPRMTAKELLEHKEDIQRQAREFMACKENVFPDQPEDVRWRQCVAMVCYIWLWLGPQKDHTPNSPLCVQTHSEEAT